MLKIQLMLMGLLAQTDPNSMGIAEAVGQPMEAGKVIMTKLSEFVAAYGLKIVGAIIILIIGRIVARFLSRLVSKTLTKAKTEPLLVSFAENLSYVILLIFVILAALEVLEVKTVSFVAVLGAAGLAVGLALQGSLSNFAAGVMLVIFRPIHVGDFVEVGGAKGTVKEIQIFNTILNSPDNVQIIVPNSQVTGSNIMNYTTNGTRRVDMVIGVSYEDDLKKTRQVIEKVLAKDERILAEPATTIAVSELADSSVNFVVRPWVKSADYWSTRFDLTEQIKVALDKNHISIPYPQRDIHMKTPTNVAS